MNKFKNAMLRIGRNAGALALVIGADIGLQYMAGVKLPEVAGFPVAIVAAPLLNALGKFGRENLEDGVAKSVCKVV